MNILLIILIVLVGLIALLFIAAMLSKKEYRATCDIIIAAPRHKVFDYLKLLKNQDHFNKWVMADPEMKRDFKGTDGTIGFVYGWNGNKQAGEGELEIKNLLEGKKIETEVRFVRPMPAIAHSNWVMESINDSQTKLSWTNASKMKMPFNIMSSMIERMLVKDMNASLANLRAILEK